MGAPVTKTLCIYGDRTCISGQPAAAWAEREGGQTQTRGFGPTSSDAQQTQINKQSELQRKSSQEFQRLSSKMCQKA